MNYEKVREISDKYRGLKILYDIKDTTSSYIVRANEENYGKLKRALDAVGVRLDIEDGQISIGINSVKYASVMNRGAGAPKTHGRIPEKQTMYGTNKLCCYADVIYWMQSMTNDQISKKIGMKIATFYRHKKELINSTYYKQLDRNRLTDLEYLESVEGNRLF